MADSVVRLTINSQEYDQKLKRASDGLQRYVDECRKVGGTLKVVEKDTLEYVKALGSMEATSRSASGKLSEMRKTFVELSMQYKQLTDQEKQSPFGTALNASLQQLKGRINETKNQLIDVNKELNMSGGKFGEFGNIIDTIGSKFGVSGNLTEMLTSKTAMLTGAVGAGIAIVTKATEAWAGYNAELAKQDQITTVTTGLKGDAANQMTDQARALVDTYNVDFREAINAANTLMTQFGESGEQAMQLIKDGMQGMIQGDGPKLLQMIQQYAPAFRDAGVSASQLVAVIQNSEGGIFTDQNMNAIVMGIKNIRLMTKATSDALAQLGIDGEKMSKQLSDGSLTIFDALKQVAGAISNVDSNSKAAGEVMQQVFGRQGVTAGTNLGKAIETLNTNLEETKKQTGEVGEAFNDLYEANIRLNTAIRDAFGYDGWEQMATGIKTTLIGALSDVIEHLAIIRQGFKDIANFFGGGNKAPAGKGYEDVEKTQQWINNGKDDNERRRRYDKAIADLQNKLNNVGKEYQVRNSDGSVSFRIDDEKTQAAKRAALERRMSMLYATSYTPTPVNNPTTTPTHSGSKTKKQKPDLDKDEFVEIIGLIGNAQERVADLQKQLRESWDQDEIVNLRKKLKDAQNELDVLQGKLPKNTVAEITVTANTAEALQKVENIEGVTIDPKTMTVTSNTSEALQKVQEMVADIDGTIAEIKVVPVMSDEDVERSIRQRYGKPVEMPVVPKTAGEQLVQSIRIKLAEDNMEADKQTLRTLLETQIKYGIESVEIPKDALLNKIMGDGLDANIPDEYWEDLQTQINEKLKELNVAPIKIDFKTGSITKEGEKTKETWQDAARAVGSVGNALQQIEDPSAKIAGLIGQAIANIALGFAQATASDSKLGVFGWIAAIAGGMATMLSTISAIHSATGYAQGGIVDGRGGGFVGGMAYSGDNVGNVRLDSGELVLNRAQQSTLATQLEGGGMQNLRLSAVITGEQIRLVLNNNGRRTGKGEYVQTNFR